MKKNHIIKSFRIDKEQDDLITRVSSMTGFTKIQIVRWLLNRGLQQLNGDIAQAHGIENLYFNLKEIYRINNR